MDCGFVAVRGSSLQQFKRVIKLMVMLSILFNIIMTIIHGVLSYLPQKKFV